jgi:membrane-associated PAP2 superfamily phosphatase
MVGVALKTALIALVVATADILSPDRPRLARFILVVGIVAGIVGAFSNSSFTPFVVG